MKFKTAWKQKLMSLFVSAKVIFFMTVLFLSTFLLIQGFISEDIFKTIVVTNITVIAGFRGAIQIAEVIKNKERSTKKKLEQESETEVC